MIIEQQIMDLIILAGQDDFDEFEWEFYEPKVKELVSDARAEGRSDVINQTQTANQSPRQVRKDLAEYRRDLPA